MESTDSSSGSQQPQLPPGFRFHPTDEELVVHYLKKKTSAAPLPVSIIADVDLYKFDPWELPAKAIFGEEEWYFFSPRERKYPNGARPNRASTSGYWKATGTDKPVLTAGGTQIVGVKKALVFYGGKPPKGVKTDWIMHEYRLADSKPTSKPPGCDFTNKKASLRLDDWVLCRIYKKHNAQRPADQEHEDLHDVIGSMIPPSISNLAEQQQQQHNNEQNMYENMMNDHAMINAHLASPGSKSTLIHMNMAHTSLPAERIVPNSSFWDDDGRNPNSQTTNRFLSENCVARNDNDQTMPNMDNSTVNILGQLPHQTPSLHQQEQAMLGDIGDGVFEQQAYQVSGMNWYT